MFRVLIDENKVNWMPTWLDCQAGHVTEISTLRFNRTPIVLRPRGNKNNTFSPPCIIQHQFLIRGKRTEHFIQHRVLVVLDEMSDSFEGLCDPSRESTVNHCVVTQTIIFNSSRRLIILRFHLLWKIFLFWLHGIDCTGLKGRRPIWFQLSDQGRRLKMAVEKLVVPSCDIIWREQKEKDK